MAMTPAARSQAGGGDAGSDLVHLAIGFIVLQSIILALFYLSRYTQGGHKAGIEMRLFMPFGDLFCVGNAIMAILLVKLGGAGRHILDLDLETIVRLAKLFKAEEMIYVASVMFPKLAILSLYIRLFLNPVRRFSYLTGAFVVVNFFARLLTWAFMCQPFAFNWNKTISGGHFINTNKSYAYFSIPNLFSDVAIILLPFHPLWKLQVPRSTKIGLFVTFALGAFGMITAIVRFISFLTIDLRSDVSFQAPKTMKWTMTEPAMYQIAATLPTLRLILTSNLSSLSSLSLFSKFSQDSPSQRSGNSGGGAVDAADRNQFVKLDDYHYTHNSKGAKRLGRNHSGVLRTTDVSVPRHTNNDIEEHELIQYAN